MGLEPILTTHHNLKLVLVGDGNDLPSIKEYVEESRLNHKVITTGRVPYREVLKYIAMSDIGLSLVPPLSPCLIASPCKLFEYLSMSIPVIANNEIPEHKRVMEGSKLSTLLVG